MNKGINLVATSINERENDIIRLQSEVLSAKLHDNHGKSKWFYIPRYLVRNLELKLGDYAYFYTVDNSAIIISFKEPDRVRKIKRKISYAGDKENLILTFPKRLLVTEAFDKIKTIRFVNITGLTNYEQQIIVQ